MLKRWYQRPWSIKSTQLPVSLLPGWCCERRRSLGTKQLPWKFDKGFVHGFRFASQHSGLSVEEVFTYGNIIGFSITKQQLCQREIEVQQSSP